MIAYLCAAGALVLFVLAGYVLARMLIVFLEEEID